MFPVRRLRSPTSPTRLLLRAALRPGRTATSATAPAAHGAAPADERHDVGALGHRCTGPAVGRLHAEPPQRLVGHGQEGPASPPAGPGQPRALRRPRRPTARGAAPAPPPPWRPSPPRSAPSPRPGGRRAHRASTRPRPATRQPSAPAPMRGPAGPSALGTIRVSSVNDRRALAMQLGVGGREERSSETDRHRPAHHDELEVEQAHHRRHGPPHQPTGAPHHVGSRLGRGLPGHRRDGRTRRLGFEAAARPAAAHTTVGLHDHVADVAGVARRPVEEASVDDDAPTDAGGHHHGEKVTAPARRAHPSFAQRERLGVIVQGHPEARGLFESRSQRKVVANPGC